MFLIAGCGPLSLDLTANWGSNQKISKTLTVDQKQTDAQVAGQTSFWDDVVAVIPFLTPKPTPTPAPEQQKVKSITIELEPKAVPEIPVYTTQPYLAPARKPKPYKSECVK